jgi:hypothetical protein
MHACGTPHQDHFLSQVARFDVEENVRDKEKCKEKVRMKQMCSIMPLL